MSKQHLLIALVTAFAATTASAADLVVVANPSAGPLTKAQVADIFMGKDQSYTPVDVKDSDPLYAEFYQKATGRDVAQVKSAWARLVFSGKAHAPKQYADADSVKKAIAGDPKAIGYIEKSAVDNSVKAVLTLEN